MCIDLQLETHFGIRKGVVKDLELFWNVEDCNDPNIDTVAIFDFKNEFVKSNYIIDVNKIFKNLNIETVNISDSIIKVLIFFKILGIIYIFRNRIIEIFNYLYKNIQQ